MLEEKKNNNLYNDKSERTWVSNENDLNKILDEYSLVLKQYIQIMELKKIKKDFLWELKKQLKEISTENMR